MLPIARTMVFLVFALAVASMPASAAEDKAPPDEKLIEQLGSSDFAQRERAARMLQARGPAALPALRKAKTHRDAEVRRRVREMIPVLEMAAALEPKRVTLGREPQTLSAILQEIEKQTGYKIEAEEAGAKEYRCFEMKGVPFWEAVERIGRETGRAVSVAADEKELRLNPSEARSPFVALRGPFRLELKSIHEDRDIDFTQPGNGKETGQRSHRLTLTISVLVEPRLVFLNAGQANVLIATDEDGKTLRPPAPAKELEYIPAFRELSRKDFEQTSEILLQRSSAKVRKIKVLRGTIPAQVLAERKRVVFTANVLKAKGAKCRVSNGTLEITKATREKNGDLHFHITVPVEPVGASWRWQDCFRLEDSKGNLYEPYMRGTTSSGGSPMEGITLTYNVSQDPKVGPPSKLIVEDWTTLHYAIPFEFQDVPLP